MDVFVGSKPVIMAVVNLTPDSFSDGGQFKDVDDVWRYIEDCFQQGADIIDVGAESTRPGSDGVDVAEEWNRLEPIVSEFKKRFDGRLSIDTSKAEIARRCLECAADMINDVTALDGDAGMLHVLAEFKPAVCLMHMQGTPRSMQQEPAYVDVIDDVYVYLEHKVKMCRDHGLTSIVVDPGIGFGKTLEHNVVLLRHLERFKSLNCPIMVGTSRKSFINALSESAVDQRLGGTIASNLLAWQQGARVFRVHDVQEIHQAFQVAQAIEGGVHV